MPLLQVAGTVQQVWHYCLPLLQAAYLHMNPGTLQCYVLHAASSQHAWSLQAVRTIEERCCDFLLQVAYDMQKAWEARCRSYYQERYDTMRNAVRPLQTDC